MDGVKLNSDKDAERLAGLFTGIMPKPLSSTAPIWVRYEKMSSEELIGTLKSVIREVGRTFLRDLTFIDNMRAGESQDEAVKKAAGILGIKILEGKAAEAAKAEARKNAQKGPKAGPRYDAPELAPSPATAAAPVAASAKIPSTETAKASTVKSAQQAAQQVPYNKKLRLAVQKEPERPKGK